MTVRRRRVDARRDALGADERGLGGEVHGGGDGGHCDRVCTIRVSETRACVSAAAIGALRLKRVAKIA